MLKTLSYIPAAKTTELQTYYNEHSWTLFTYEGRGYIGEEVYTILTEDYEFEPVTEKTFLVRDDDASHLHLPEYEGIFEMRCLDLEEEARRLIAGL